MRRRRFSPARLRELLVYIVSSHPEGVERSKLYWLAFWADMESYRHLGDSITGATWVKTPLGYPLPMRKKDAQAFARRRHAF